MTEKELFKVMDTILIKHQCGCGPFSLWLLYYRYGSITLEEAAEQLKVSHITINKWNKVLLKYKLIIRSSKKDFSITQTVLQAVSSNIDPIRQAHKIIVEKVLAHKRYVNSTYRKKNFNIMTEAVYEKINCLLNKKLGGSLKLVEAYCLWWTKKKIQLQFNYGLFTCDNLVNEFSNTNRPKIKKKVRQQKKKRDRIKKKMSKLEAEVGVHKIHRKTI